MKSWSLAKDTGMTKLDPTLKHIGLVLRRRLTDTPSTETSSCGVNVRYSKKAE